MSTKYNVNKNINVCSASTHVPPEIQADTLFSFVDKLDYIIKPLRDKKVFPRYCQEDISYLKLQSIKNVMFPMKCFCDINLHRMHIHLRWYGYYGLAFTKEWGMNKGIQPLHYINKASMLSKDFSKVFKKALSTKGAKSPKELLDYKSFLLHELMFYKPYDGQMYCFSTGKKSKKCFMDECEWRYVPQMTSTTMEKFIFDQTIIDNSDLKRRMSDALELYDELALSFEYSDLKYIIVKDEDDFETLIDEIDGFPISTIDKERLVSKVIVWEASKGDF